MTDDTTILLLGAGLLAYQMFKDTLGASAAAGKAVAQAAQNVMQQQTQQQGGALTWANFIATGQRSMLQIAQGQTQGIPVLLEAVPPTPAGFLPSNWTWKGPNNTKIGLPAGMTFAEFCAVSPGSPMCSPGYWGL